MRDFSQRARRLPIGAALTHMAASAKKFDIGKVRERDLALVAAISSGEPEVE